MSSTRVTAIFAIVFGLLALSAPCTYAAARHRPREREAAPQPPSVPLNQIQVLGGMPAPFALDAKAAILVAGQSGAVLYAYNEHVKMQPASLAKIMTFYLTLQALKQGRIAPDTQIPISEAAWRLSMDQSVSRMFLQVGSHVAVHDLLYGLMVSSGNDAAVALAEYLGGSSEGFTAQMNAMAKQLGLDETHFQNPDGLPAADEYTTAADMAKLGRLLTERFPEAFTYTSTKEFVYDKIKQPNFNHLLFHDARVNGLKTGHVEEAGYHLVATASSNGMNLIAAVMGTPSEEKRWSETEKLIDWGFRTFVTAQPDWRKSVASSMPVYEGVIDQVAIAPEAVPYVTVQRGQETHLSVESILGSRYLTAPITKGQSVGTMTVTLAGKPQAQIPIKTQAAVARAGFFKRLGDSIRRRL